MGIFTVRLAEISIYWTLAICYLISFLSMPSHCIDEETEAHRWSVLFVVAQLISGRAKHEPWHPNQCFCHSAPCLVVLRPTSGPTLGLWPWIVSAADLLCVSVVSGENGPASSVLDVACEGSSWTGLCKPLLCLFRNLKAADEEERTWMDLEDSAPARMALLFKKLADSGPWRHRVAWGQGWEADSSPSS